MKFITYILVFNLVFCFSPTFSDEVCIAGSKVAYTPFSAIIVNYTIVGPVMSSISTKNDRECEMECHLAVPDLCYMFNYHPSSKVCELLYKDRAAEYKVEKKDGSTFKTHKCYIDPCVNEGQCYSLGDQKSSLCLCPPMLNGTVCDACKEELSSAVQHIDVITNYTIVGPLLTSVTTMSEGLCQCFCQWYGQGRCDMFNYYPSSKACELFYKNRPAEYKVEKKEGSTFKAHRCSGINPCLNGGTCLLLGSHDTADSEFCLCKDMFGGKFCQHHTCDVASSTIHYTQAYDNYTIVGPVLWSFVATNESSCQCACEKNEQNLCYMFNFNPTTKSCELFFKNRTAEYSVVARTGSTFKTRKCSSSPCYNAGICLLFGEESLTHTKHNKHCLCPPMFYGTICNNQVCNITTLNTLYSSSLINLAITGPSLWSFVAKGEQFCQCACEKNAQNLCYMFNFNPTTKSCELFFKNRTAEYSVVARTGSTFKTRKCATDSPCFRGKCYSLGGHESNLCACDFEYSGKHCHVHSRGIKVNSVPVCIGAKGNSFGTFVAPFNGKVKTFRLVHLAGGVGHGADTNTQGNWGAKGYTSWGIHHPSKIELHVTNENKARITPPPGYPLYMNYGRMGYDVPGYNCNSPELVFPEITPITVTKGQKFNIWYGQDYMDSTEGDNHGTTCANVYIYYTQ